MKWDGTKSCVGLVAKVCWEGGGLCFRRSLDPSPLSFPRTFCTCGGKRAHNVHSGANRSCSRQSLHHDSPEWRRPLQYRLVPGTFYFFIFFSKHRCSQFFFQSSQTTPCPPPQKKKKKWKSSAPRKRFLCLRTFRKWLPCSSVAPPTFLTAMTWHFSSGSLWPFPKFDLG